MNSAAVAEKTSLLYQPLRCYGFRGDEKTLESSNYTLFNPTSQPGCAVMAGSCAARASIGGQVACRLALEHFTTALLDYYATLKGKPESEENVNALETAFREANRSVYSFGHSLAAGGRMAAVFLALIIRDGRMAAGRVGGGSAYLLRDGELFSFFDLVPSERAEDEESYLGSRSMVAVDLANVEVEGGDSVFLFSEGLDASKENELKGLAQDVAPDRVDNPAEYISRFLFDSPAGLGYTFALYIGQEAVFMPSDMIIENA